MMWCVAHVYQGMPVTGDEATTDEDTNGERRRWDHGAYLDGG